MCYERTVEWRGQPRGAAWAVAIVLTLSAVGGVSVRAETIHVPGDYPTIQEAIDAAVDGDEVVIADGTYTGASNTNLDFGGRLVTVRSASDDPALCIIDCEGAQGVRGFHFHSGETEKAVVKGLTIRQGRATSAGGVRITGADPTIRNCIFQSNRAIAEFRGGGIWIGGEGGGLRIQDGSPLILACRFSENDAGNKSDADLGGGAVFIEGSGTPRLIDCVFDTNSSLDGGAIMSRVEVVVSGCRFVENGSTFAGSAIQGSAVVSGSSFARNRTAVDGAAIWAHGASVSIAESIFCANDPRHIAGDYDDGGGNVFADSCRTVCPADVDDSGEVDFGDILLVLAAWNQMGERPEDCTGDEFVDFADILCVLSSWGPCP